MELFKTIKRIPKIGWIMGIVMFAMQAGIYKLGHLIASSTGTINWAISSKIDVIDNAIPIVPIFAIIYLFSYVFWICGPIAASLTKKSNFINYMLGLSIAYIIGLLIFIFLPTYMDREAEGLFEIAKNSPLLGFIYENDGGTIAYNLFPSFHCLLSVYCYLGVRKQDGVSKGFRIYSLIVAILICLSTVFTKQHYFADVVGGVGLALITSLLVRKLNLGEKLEKKISKEAVVNK